MLLVALLIFLGLLVLGFALVWARVEATFWRDIDDTFDLNPAALPRQSH